MACPLRPCFSFPGSGHSLLRTEKEFRTASVGLDRGEWEQQALLDVVTTAQGIQGPDWYSLIKAATRLAGPSANVRPSLWINWTGVTVEHYAAHRLFWVQDLDALPARPASRLLNNRSWGKELSKTRETIKPKIQDHPGIISCYCLKIHPRDFSPCKYK